MAVTCFKEYLAQANEPELTPQMTVDDLDLNLVEFYSSVGRRMVNKTGISKNLVKIKFKK